MKKYLIEGLLVPLAMIVALGAAVLVISTNARAVEVATLTVVPTKEEVNAAKNAERDKKRAEWKKKKEAAIKKLRNHKEEKQEVPAKK